MSKMRVACVCAALALAACAKGGNGATVDATGGPLVDAGPDAPSCNDLPCEAIYVARSGSDAAAGTKEAPLQTISGGIVKAAGSTPPLAVFVQSGMYTEQVIMKPGVTIYGGFDETWTQSPAVVTEIKGESPAVVFDQIATGTGLVNVTIKTVDATAPGASTYAVVITSSQMIELRDVVVEPGIAARGGDGGDGGAGANGGNGANGTPGCENSGGFCSGCSHPRGAAGGTSSCGRTGGRGGDAGHGGGNGQAGFDGVGSPGSGGTPGPQGQGQNGTPGGTGGTGAAGAPGSNGGGGLEVGMFHGAIYAPSNGASGTSGGHGNGGGGGGGGGGGNDNCDSYGSSGGGGGAGGCGGTFGTAGTGGGGSFGVVAVDSSVTVRSSMVIANRGGDGGAGGRGGAGGSRGSPGSRGGYGGSGEQDDGGMGGNGGFGGAGGAGGHGGGGGGGPSAALVCVGTATIAIPQSTVMGGTGGNGGSSPGNAGANGVSTRAIGCSFF